MKDRMGREIDYMRFSITDRCNLRCKYCMPDGIDCMPRWDVLSLEEFEAIAIAAASLGIKKIKVTGGEPLARKSCPQLVKMLKNIPGIEKVTLPTNGVQMDQYLDQRLDAGLDAINVSLDTVDPVLYEKITGRDKLADVMRFIEKAESLPIPVKINAVFQLPMAISMTAHGTSTVPVPKTGKASKIPLPIPTRTGHGFPT